MFDTRLKKMLHYAWLSTITTISVCSLVVADEESSQVSVPEKMRVSDLRDPVTNDYYYLCRVENSARSDNGALGFIKHDSVAGQRLCFTRQYIRQGLGGAAQFTYAYHNGVNTNLAEGFVVNSYSASSDRSIGTLDPIITNQVAQNNLLTINASNGNALNAGNGGNADILCRSNSQYKTLGYLSADTDSKYYCWTSGYTNPNSSFKESSFSILYDTKPAPVIENTAPTSIVIENENITAVLSEVEFFYSAIWANNTISSVEYVFDKDLVKLTVVYPPNTIADITSAWGADASIARQEDADVITLTKKPDITYEVTQIGFNLEIRSGVEFRSLVSVSSELNNEPVKVLNHGIKSDAVTTTPNASIGFDPFPKALNNQVVTRYSGASATHKTFKRPTYKDDSGNEHEYLIGGYYTDWGVYPTTNYTPNQIPVNNVNFIQISFAAICSEGDASNWFGNESATIEARPKIAELCQGKPTGTMIIPDHFSHYGKADMNLPEWERKWNKPAYHVPGYLRYVQNPFKSIATKEFFNVGEKKLIQQDNYDYAWGLKNDFSHYDRVLNRHGRNFNMYLSIGGWTLSDPFPVIAANPSYRTTFIRSVVNYLELNPHITGIDLDWEFVGVDGAKTGAMSSADTDNHTKLIYELRQALDVAGNYHLTAAVGTAPKHLNEINWNSKVIDGQTYPGVSEMLDNIFLMSYDYYGAFDSKVGHHTALYTNGELAGYSVDSAVQYLKSIGVNSRKLILGYAGYGRLWSNVVESADNQDPNYAFPNQAIGQHPGEIGTVEAANLAWRHIKLTAFDESGNLKANYSFVRDEKAKAEFLVATNPDDSSKNVVVTLDTPWSVEQKAKYVKDQQLGGMFTWALDNDNGDLLNAAHAGFGSQKLYDDMQPSPRENSLMMYRSKEAEYCSNPNIVFEYALDKTSNIIINFFTFGTKSLYEAVQGTFLLLAQAISSNKSVFELTDEEWQEYFDLIQSVENVDGSPTTLDASKLNKQSVLDALRAQGKSGTFIAIGELVTLPTLAGFGLTAVNDIIWDHLVPPVDDYCGQITRDTLDPWEKIKEDFPELKENFNY